jgi:putative transposase
VLHQVANGIIEEAVEYACSTIVFEKLTNIRANIPEAKWQHRWAFRQLFSYVEYKAEALGIAVETVPSNYTSQRCSRVGCGFTARENRPSRDHFCCQKCDHEANADYNAARNIGLRYVRRGRQSSRRTGDGQLALKSGTVTPKCGFTAYARASEAESTDKPHPQA